MRKISERSRKPIPAPSSTSNYFISATGGIALFVSLSVYAEVDLVKVDKSEN